MLKSVTGVSIKADQLIRSFSSWADGTAQHLTDTSKGLKAAVEVRALVSQTQQFADIARAIIADAATYNTLDQNVKDDLVAIAEECEAGIAELVDETDAEKAWTRMAKQTKDDVTQQIRIPEAALKRMRSRLEGKLRGQPKKTLTERRDDSIAVSESVKKKDMF